ncbi:MAG: hypothetical protein AMJ53_04110, partial [Gammaproteobacteria bacterium SG8_11]
TLGVVASLAEARNLPENYEPLVADHGPLSLAELVEDEILLALPAIAMHAEPCSMSGAKNATVEQRKAADSMYNPPTADFIVTDEGKPNPFAVLADLKEKLSK